TDSTFTDNSASNAGGAIDNRSGTITISNSTLTGNLADVGGAIYNSVGTVSSQDTHYENNTCFGKITDNGGNTTTNARHCPVTEPVNDDNTGDIIISTCDFVTLQSAVSVANSGGGVISITCTGTIIFEDKLTIAADMTITNDSGGEVIFDETGDDNGFFHVNTVPSFTLNGFTLQNGNAEDGGAIYNNGTLTISNSTFIGNSADDIGGAIWSNGTLTISDSTFTDNSASRNGGAIFNGGTLTISDSTFMDNSASRNGGAIYNIRATLTIINSTFTDNLATGDGGAINNFDGTASSQDTQYENNTCAGDITDNG
ncbi:MAG TPA: hypothetical protein PLZ51_10680, partial [Aggregatilineales bacterium]|nr:hypothetical protein [Aggregatilineales bacterium]